MGADIYAAYIVQFYFFTSAIGLLTSPLEHALIRLRNRPGYDSKFVQIFWAYIFITIVACCLAELIYILFPFKVQNLSSTNLTVLTAVAIASVASQIVYFLKFFRSDWYYYFAEALGYLIITVLVVLLNFLYDLNLLIFAWLSALTYVSLTLIRLFQLYKQVLLNPPQIRRIGLLLLRAFRSTTMPSLFGAVVKRADALYMPVMDISPVTVLVYRLIRNIISAVSLVGITYAQDIWMSRRVPRQAMSYYIFFIASVSFMALLALVVWLYINWLEVSNPLKLADICCIALSTTAAIYLSLNAADINRVYQQGRYDVILAGSTISFLTFLTLLIFGNLINLTIVTYLLVLIFFPQLANSLYIQRQQDKTRQEIS